jgi:hypothetical protein
MPASGLGCWLIFRIGRRLFDEKCRRGFDALENRRSIVFEECNFTRGISNARARMQCAPSARNKSARYFAAASIFTPPVVGGPVTASLFWVRSR